MKTNSLVQRIWALCQTLRDDGVSYGDYLQQLTFLLFLKMADEVFESSSSTPSVVPVDLGWRNLSELRGAGLLRQYEADLKELAGRPGMVGAIFDRSQNKIDDPEKLRHLIRLIDQERWLDLNEDVKGDLYEGLLQRNAEDIKSGAGQYFTPRPLIDAIVECLRPEPMKTIADPACGTGGFFLGAYKWLSRPEAEQTLEQAEFLRHGTFVGNEIVAETRRIALMNLFLHGIGTLNGTPAISRSDALLASGTEVDYVLANPPFGRKSGFSPSSGGAVGAEAGSGYDRPEFWEKTSNKQLNFIQHIVAMLKPGGRAAVVVPDNVLFEGGSGERVRRELLNRCNLHTVLRLPSGIFYANGVQANVLFFDKSDGTKLSATQGVWMYDLRTDMHLTRIRNPLKSSHLKDFVESYSPGDFTARLETQRFRYFSIEQIAARPRADLDISWPLVAKQPDDGLGRSLELQREIVSHLQAALVAFDSVETEIMTISPDAFIAGR